MIVGCVGDSESADPRVIDLKKKNKRSGEHVGFYRVMWQLVGPTNSGFNPSVNKGA